MALALLQYPVEQALPAGEVGHEGIIAEETPEGRPLIGAVAVEERREGHLQVLASHRATLAVEAQALTGGDDGPARLVLVEDKLNRTGDRLNGYVAMSNDLTGLRVALTIEIGPEAVQIDKDDGWRINGWRGNVGDRHESEATGINRSIQATQPRGIEAKGGEQLLIPSVPRLTGLRAGLAKVGAGLAVVLTQQAAVRLATERVEFLGVLTTKDIEEIVGREEGPLVDDCAADGVSRCHKA